MWFKSQWPNSYFPSEKIGKSQVSLDRSLSDQSQAGIIFLTDVIISPQDSKEKHAVVRS